MSLMVSGSIDNLAICPRMGAKWKGEVKPCPRNQRSLIAITQNGERASGHLDAAGFTW